MFKNMGLAGKIGFGFFLLILIAGILGGLAVFNMSRVEGQATILATESIPEVKVANNVERYSLNTMYEMRGYALTGDEKYHEAATQKLDEVKKYLTDAKALGASSPRLAELKHAAEKAETEALKYEGLAKTTSELLKAIEEDRAKLNEDAQEYMKACAEFLEGQNEHMKAEITGEALADAGAASAEAGHAAAPNAEAGHAETGRAEAPNAEAGHAEAPTAEVMPLACAAAEPVLKTLQDGNARYVGEKMLFPDISQQRRAETTAGQHPIVTMVSCSDSRVPVEAIFDQGIGTIFVVRVAGNISGPDELGSVEYGVGHLETPLLVVLGHSKCGAVTAAATGASVHGHIKPLIDAINPVVESVKAANAGIAGEDLVKAAITENIWYTIETMLTKSAELQARVKEGKVKVVGAMYHVDNGQVDWLGTHPKEGAILAKPAVQHHDTPHAAPSAQGQMADADKLLERLQKITIVNDIMDLGNATRIGVWKAQALRDPKLAAEVMPNFAQMDAKFDALKPITHLEADLKRIEDTRAAAHAYKSALEELLVNWSKLEEVNQQRGEVAAAVLSEAETTARNGMESATGVADTAVASLSLASTIMLVGMALAIAIAILLAVLITRSITKPVNIVISSLSQGAEQVQAASDQVAQSSQAMAEGASEQASSLEETSASLEEMASMTRQNAGNANQANGVAGEARASAEKGREAMLRMSNAINQIKNSSDETAKIIKTIDEIAFQTNLLALNAAVEAARAGDAGKGFAVVAEEVRNLAQRSATAAKNTSALIEGAQKNADNGVAVTAEVAQILDEIATAAHKVTQLVSEVSEATNEQAQGIDQVNTAVAQMDKVTQSNAANSEEAASASEELSAQARELNDMVLALTAIVGGAGSKRNAVHDTHVDRGSAIHGGQRPVSALMVRPRGGGRNSKADAKAMVAADAHRIVHPQEVIPLGDDE